MLQRRYILLSTAVAVAGLFTIGLARFAAVVAEYRPFSGGEADGIVVLTGGEQRIAEAVRLLSANAAKRLLVSGANRETSKEQLLRVLHLKGAGAYTCCIDMGYEAEDTAGNAMEARAWASRNNFSSLIIVTSNYHMPRSLLEFERTLPGVRLIPHAVANRNVRAEAWWAYPRTALTLAKEYVKFIRATLLARLAGPLPRLPGPAVGAPQPAAAPVALKGAPR